MVYIPWNEHSYPDYSPPERIDLRRKPTWHGDFRLEPQYVMKVTVTMQTNINNKQNTVISTKTYLPRITWQ